MYFYITCSLIKLLFMEEKSLRPYSEDLLYLIQLLSKPMKYVCEKGELVV